MTLRRSLILGTEVTLTSSAIARASLLARLWQSELVLVRSPAAPPQKYSADVLNADVERIMGFVTATQPFQPVRVVNSSGDPATALAAVARASSSIAVLGPCKEPANVDALRRTAVDVVKQAQQPVLVARSNIPQPVPYARLLFFLDQAVEGASWLPRVSQLFPLAKVHLLKRYTRPYPAFLGNIISDEELQEDALDEVAECLDTHSISRKVRDRVHVTVGIGDPRRLVERFARAYFSDLIVLPFTVAQRHFLESDILSHGGSPFAPYSRCDFLLCPG